MFLAFNEELPKSIADQSGQIIRSYLHINQNKEKCLCPFHKERTPSFTVFEDGFKCYGCGKYGNAINFVQDYFNLSFTGAVKKITNDDTYYSDTMVSSNSRNSHGSTRNKEHVEIRFRSKKFTTLELDYWKKYGITQPTLEKNNVIPGKEIFLQSHAGFYLYYEYQKKNPAFIYDLGNKHYKIYFPYGRTTKFISNCPSRMWQGEIDYNYDHLVITSSYKDKMLLEEYGYNSIAPQSENSIPDLSPVKDYFNNLLVLFDNGPEEIKCGQQLAEMLECPYSYVHTYFEEKDPTDFYYAFGSEWTKSLLEDLIDKNFK